ncbi:MAG: hypothetical protein HFH41_05460 [Lachnospiraceae bacterium]|nr:hypothetical protein [Lachnospiraceae bacterium]
MNVKKHGKMVGLLLTAIMAAMLLVGCGNSFDASEYIQALLDNSYKGESESLVKQKVGTKEECEKLYNDGLDSQVTVILGSTASEEQKAEFREVMTDIYEGVKYTVGDSTKKDNSYEVEVKCQRMKIFEPALETFANNITGEESEEELINALIESFKTELGNVTYDEEESVTVRVELVDKTWTPNSEDVLALQYALFDSESLATMLNQ